MNKTIEKKSDKKNKSTKSNKSSKLTNIEIEESNENIQSDNQSIKSNQSTKSNEIKSNDINLDNQSDNLSEPKEKIVLTKEQKKVYEELVKFISNKNDNQNDNQNNNQILLVGYAGTGKTTMITKIIFDFLKLKLCKKIVVAAPTHKAVNIAKSKLFDNIGDNEKLSNNIDIMTIHRLLNYQSYIDSDTGDKYFAKSSVNPNWTIYDLIVVDECSMLSNQIITDISDQMKNQANSKLKLIYVGDPAQLPPVNQPDSKIFNMGLKKLELDKIIRTKDNDIMDLSNDHRKWIFSKKNEDIPNVFKYNSDKITIYKTFDNEQNKWLDKFVKIIGSKKKKYKTDYDNNIILTWTNKKCNNYNQYVREKIFNKKDLAHFEKGEILIFNDFHRIQVNKIINQPNDNNTDPEKVVKDYVSFYTSEQIKVIEIEKIKYKFNEIKFKTNSNLTEELNDKFKKKIKSINEIINVELDAFQMDIKRMSDIKTINEDSAQIHQIYTIHPDSEKTLSSIVDEFEHIVLKLRKACHKLIMEMKKIDNMGKCNLQGEVDKKINKLYRDWQENVIDRFAQLNYGYSITVHKSQGSTFKNVFIDISDILDNNNIDETSKCLYTAITRSSNSIELLI
jgi:hypothetical protein